MKPVELSLSFINDQLTPKTVGKELRTSAVGNSHPTVNKKKTTLRKSHGDTRQDQRREAVFGNAYRH
jgi:hypothetical protein